MTYINQAMSVKASSEGIQKVRQCMAELIRPNSRDEKGWTIPDLAERSGAGESTVKRFLKGIPVKFDSLVWITGAVGLKPEDVIDAPLNETEASIVNWIAICGGMLAKQKEARQLRKEATAIGAEVNVYVPLDLLEHKEQTRSKQEKADSDQRNQYQERKVVKTYEHDDFLRSLTDRQSKNKHIAIVGEAGAGKTTLLARIAEELDKNQKLQIFVSLADLRERSLEEYIYGNWLSKALGLQTDSINAEQKSDLFQQFQSGEIWLLLDGLDEMRAKSSADALEKINHEIREVIGQSRVVLTSRLNVWDAYLNGLSGFDTFRMGDFSPEQVDQFISDWFVEAGKPESAPILQAKLKEPNRDRIRDMVRHPLRLALLCQAFYRDLNTELPETKAGLYELFVRYFYEWKPNIVDEDLTQDSLREELHLALGKLAIAGIDGDAGFRLSRSLAVKEMGDRLFKLASDVGWLTLIERDEQDQEVYAFYHASFQEYFAALAIDDWDFFIPKNHIDKPLKDELSQYIRYRIFEAIWQESIIVWMGRGDVLDREKVDFIQKIVLFEDGCKSLYFFQNWFLSVKLLIEAQDIVLLREKLNKIINSIIKWRFGEYSFTNNQWNNPPYIFKDKCEQSLSMIRNNIIFDKLLHILNTSREQILECFNSKHKELLNASKNGVSLEENILKIYNATPYGIIDIAKSIKQFSRDESLITDISINILCEQKYLYDYYIYSEIFPDKISNIETVEKIIEILLQKKYQYLICRDQHLLMDINFLINCLRKSNVLQPRIVNELTNIIKDTNYVDLHLTVAEIILGIDSNNQLAISEIMKPLNHFNNEDDEDLSEMYSVLETCAVENKQIIDLLSQIIREENPNTDKSFYAIDCLGVITKNNQSVINLLIDCLRKANDMESQILILENDNEYSEQMDEFNNIVNNICNVLSVMLDKTLHNHNIIDSLENILNKFRHFLNRLYVAECIDNIVGNDSITSYEMSDIIESGQYKFLFTDDFQNRHFHEFKYPKNNSYLIDSLLRHIEKEADTKEKVKLVKILLNIDNSQAYADWSINIIQNSKFKIEYAKILAQLNLNNDLASNILFGEILNIEREKSIHPEYHRGHLLYHLLPILEDSNIMKHMVNSVALQGIDDIYNFLWHCAQNMSYPDFYEALHSQHTSTHPEIADTIPSNNTNKIQILESQLIDCELIQKELDRNTDHPEIRCLVVDIRQLEQESDPNVIAKKLTNKIFNSIGRRIPVVQDVSCLERELLNLKFELGFEKLAIALYGKSANEAINQVCQNLAPIQIRPFTGGQTTEELITQINAWLLEM